jgi:uncharacterized protein YeeX (DUF496 family)
MAESKTIKEIVLENFSLKRRRERLLEDIERISKAIKDNEQLLEDSFINEAFIKSTMADQKKEGDET